MFVPFPFRGLLQVLFFMAALYGIGQAVIFSSCGFFFLSYFFFLSFFLAYSQPSQIGCLPYFHTWCGLSANLRCRSETCCTRLAENTGRQKMPKIRHLCTIAQICPAISSQLRHILTIGKKFVKQQYIFPICPHNIANFGPLAAETGSLVWAHQQISTGFAFWLRYCSDVAQRKPTKLCTMFGRLLGWYTI